jgi:hypothetical protein
MTRDWVAFFLVDLERYSLFFSWFFRMLDSESVVANSLFTWLSGFIFLVWILCDSRDSAAVQATTTTVLCDRKEAVFEQCGFWLSYWRLYAVVFGVPLVSGRNHMNAFDLEVGVVVTQSPSVRALFRTDSASYAAVLVSVYSDWKFSGFEGRAS